MKRDIMKLDLTSSKKLRIDGFLLLIFLYVITDCNKPTNTAVTFILILIYGEISSFNYNLNGAVNSQ